MNLFMLDLWNIFSWNGAKPSLTRGFDRLRNSVRNPL
ncbi:MAG: hypothetical protein Hyperionvirus14_34 [Hyperionvirus sp.]|uniref:Uncharacterized protein n=1 Tax=Hyperionvirus sp. TaxID=2487770 RepID=A0A3G5A9P1_9VIRU|nr:MAG: hypothetical protein Hyperionvirus14_34 [Hyperionvirus sp.]